MKKNLTIFPITLVLSLLLMTGCSHHKHDNVSSNQLVHKEDISGFVYQKFAVIRAARSKTARKLARIHFAKNGLGEVKKIFVSANVIPIYGVQDKNADDIDLLYFVVPVWTNGGLRGASVSSQAELKIVRTATNTTTTPDKKEPFDWQVGAVSRGFKIRKLSQRNPRCEILLKQKTNAWYAWCFNKIIFLDGPKDTLINPKEFKDIDEFIQAEK